MKLLQGLKQPEESVAVNLTLRDYGRNFSDLRDAHVRQLLLLELKNRSNNARFQSIIEQFEKYNQSAIKKFEKSMLLEHNVFLRLKELWKNQDMIDPYFELQNPDPLKLLDVFASSYLKSFNAFNISIESLDPNLLHEWRKRLKDVQYQFELLFENMSSDMQKHYLKIQDLCNLLGELNDLEMISRWMTNNRQILIDEGNLNAVLSEEVLKQHETLLSVAKTNGIKLYSYTPDQFKKSVILKYD